MLHEVAECDCADEPVGCAGEVEELGASRASLPARAQGQVAVLLLGVQELLVDWKTRQAAVVSTGLDSSLSIFVLLAVPSSAL